MKTITYEHHGRTVHVMPHLKGDHKKHCLCYGCEHFYPGTPENCDIAQQLFHFDQRHGITTPVWECPEFKSRGTINLEALIERLKNKGYKIGKVSYFDDDLSGNPVAEWWEPHYWWVTALPDDHYEIYHGSDHDCCLVRKGIDLINAIEIITKLECPSNVCLT